MKKLGILVLALILAVSFTACGGGKTATSSFNSRDGKTTIAITYPESDGYRWSTENADFRTSSWEAAVIAPDFKIGVSTRTYPHGVKSFDEFIAENGDEKNFKEVTYGGAKGFSYYYESYRSYVVSLPIEGNTDNYVEIWVSEPKDDETKIDALFDSAAVQDILKTVKSTAK